jgi:hypothetical protein
MPEHHYTHDGAWSNIKKAPPKMEDIPEDQRSSAIHWVAHPPPPYWGAPPARRDGTPPPLSPAVSRRIAGGVLISAPTAHAPEPCPVSCMREVAFSYI